MKKELLPSILLTLAFMVFFCAVYPAIIWGISQFSPGKGEGITLSGPGGKIFYENIGQKFTDDKYFQSRPSAADYHADGAGGSNKGPSNPEYLADVQKRIDTFLVHNPAVKKGELPADLVTASGSGLDPHISVPAAIAQVSRIAKARGVPENTVRNKINALLEKPILGLYGTERVNVLKLNMELDRQQQKK